jgi:hypothetical protein
LFLVNAVNRPLLPGSALSVAIDRGLSTIRTVVMEKVSTRLVRNALIFSSRVMSFIGNFT